MIQVYYKEHHGYRHYTIVFRKMKGLLNGLGIEIYDTYCGCDNIVRKIEDYGAGYVCMQNVFYFSVGDRSLGKAIKMEDVPYNVRNMSKIFEQAGHSFIKHCRYGDTIYDFWKYRFLT